MRDATGSRVRQSILPRRRRDNLWHFVPRSGATPITALQFSGPYACAVVGKSVVISGVTTRLMPRALVPEVFSSHSRELVGCSGMPGCGLILKQAGCPFGRPA